jgi:hypothetical protein
MRLESPGFWLTTLTVLLGISHARVGRAEPDCSDAEAETSPRGWVCPKYIVGGDGAFTKGVWRGPDETCLAHGQGRRTEVYEDDERGIARSVVTERWVCRYGQAHGPYESFRLDGTKEYRGAYAGGSKHGQWSEWDEDGNLSTGEYCDGEQCGPWVERNGDDVHRGAYDGGKRCGSWVLASKGSRPELRDYGACTSGATEEDGYEGQVRNGAKDGEWVSKDDEGRVLGRGRYCRGQKCGAWREDGQFGAETGSYVGGNRCGRWMVKTQAGVEYEQHAPCN